MYTLVLSRNFKPARDDRGVVPTNDYTLTAFDESSRIAHKIISSTYAEAMIARCDFIALPCGDFIGVVDTLPYSMVAN